MNRIIVLCAVLAFTSIGCTARHVVIDPDEMSGLDNGSWTVSKEPNQDPAQLELEEKGQREDDSLQTR